MQRANIHGLINVNKPENITSFQIVSWFRRLTKERQVGHAGTLDPFASGVLLLLCGQATKLSRFIMHEDKAYVAKIELGKVTNTYDRDGEIIETRSLNGVTSEVIEMTLRSFLGEIEQKPPIFSAIKHRGKRYYEMARAGIQFAPKTRRVQIYNLEILNIALPFIEIKIECSSGTYIRSLAHDLGLKIGCGAYLASLVRIRSGRFIIEHSVTPQQFENAYYEGKWQDRLLPLNKLMEYLPSVILSEKQIKMMHDGRPLYLDVDLPGDGLIRALAPNGELIAILKYDRSSGAVKHEVLLQY